MNASYSSHSALWVLALAAGFGLASPRTVHAPAPVGRSVYGPTLEVPVQRYLDLGAPQVGTTSEGYTAIRSPLAPEAREPVVPALEADPARYTDLGKRPSNSLPSSVAPARD